MNNREETTRTGLRYSDEDDTFNLSEKKYGNAGRVRFCSKANDLTVLEYSILKTKLTTKNFTHLTNK